MSATVVPCGLDWWPLYGCGCGVSGRKTAPSIGWMVVPNLASRPDRSTPLSMRATDTPSPVARGSRSSRSGVSRRKMSSNTVSVPVTGGPSPGRPAGRLVEELAHLADDPDAVADGGRAVPDRQVANGLGQLERRRGVDDRVGRLVQPGPETVDDRRRERGLLAVLAARRESGGDLVARLEGGPNRVDQEALGLPLAQGLTEQFRAEVGGRIHELLVLRGEPAGLVEQLQDDVDPRGDRQRGGQDVLAVLLEGLQFDRPEAAGVGRGHGARLVHAEHGGGQRAAERDDRGWERLAVCGEGDDPLGPVRSDVAAEQGPVGGAGGADQEAEQVANGLGQRDRVVERCGRLDEGEDLLDRLAEL